MFKCFIQKVYGAMLKTPIRILLSLRETMMIGGRAGVNRLYYTAYTIRCDNHHNSALYLFLGRGIVRKRRGRLGINFS